MKKLNPKQQEFIEQYLVDFNGTQAAIRAGYSPRTAIKIASENLTKPDIQEALAKRRAELAEANEVTPERVMAEYALIGFADMSDYVTWGPSGVRLKDSEDLSDRASTAVAEVLENITEGGRTIKFKLHDKRAALDSLVKMMGWIAPAKVDVRENLVVTFIVGEGYQSDESSTPPVEPTA